jgi:hypothetical protein
MSKEINLQITGATSGAITLDVGEAAFNQEYLALFFNWEGSVFRHVTEAAIIAPGMTRDRNHQYVIGCDWGRSKDYTVFLVLDVNVRAVVEIDRSNRVDYTLRCERLKALSEKWQPLQIVAEQNSIGQPIIEQLQTRRIEYSAICNQPCKQGSGDRKFVAGVRTLGYSNPPSSSVGQRIGRVPERDTVLRPATLWCA